MQTGRVVLKTGRTEGVYQFIWNDVTEHEVLPSAQQIHQALTMPKDEIRFFIKMLRQDRRIERRIVLPTAYCDLQWLIENSH